MKPKQNIKGKKANKNHEQKTKINKDLEKKDLEKK